MRHRKKGRKLNRTSSHRAALRRNLATSLFLHERIITTPEKAKETKAFAEKLVTLAKKGIAQKEADRPAYLHCYRQALAKLQNKDAVRKLFGEGPWREQGGIAARYEDRPGGYTRILRLSGSRLGVLTGSSVGQISELEYKMLGPTPEERERKLRMTGNRLGDNTSQVIFELVEAEMPEKKAPTKDVAPRVVEEESPKPQTPVAENAAPPEEEHTDAAKSESENKES